MFALALVALPWMSSGSICANKGDVGLCASGMGQASQGCAHTFLHGTCSAGLSTTHHTAEGSEVWGTDTSSKQEWELGLNRI